MADHLESVKALAASFRTWAKNNEKKGEASAAARQITYAVAIEAAASELAAARKRLTALPTTHGDLSDLPQELLAQLNLTRLDELEQWLRDIVASGDGEVGLDPILIALFRRHGEVYQRRFIMNKLYRMAQKGLLEPVEGKKGVYTIPKEKAVRPVPAAFDDLDDDVPF